MSVIFYLELAAAQLASRAYAFEVGGSGEDYNSPKTIPGPIWSFPKIKDLIGSEVNELQTNIEIKESIPQK